MRPLGLASLRRTPRPARRLLQNSRILEKAGQYAQAFARCLDRQNQWQQARGVARIFQRPVLLTLKLHPRQLQRAVEAQRLIQAPGLGKALLEVHMRRLRERAGQAMALPFEFKLLAIVVAPAGPAFQARVMLAQPALTVATRRS